MNKKSTPLRKLSKLKLPKSVANIDVRKLPISRMRRGASDTKLTEAIQNLPRITNETVAEHREEVLSSARKYIYPLSHSKRRVVTVTTTLLITAVVLFFGYCLTALYKFQSSSTFLYGVTQVIPFPIARVGSSFVSYESYLFELRHSEHYYQNQQKEDFTTTSGKKHVARLKKDSLNQVIEDAYVKQLARQNHVSISPAEVTAEVTLVRQQNRLGSNDQVFKDVLSEFWGWTPDDFKRQLKQQLLAQKVASKLDTGAHQRAQNALNQLDQGVDFVTLAKQVSDDATTKASGGDYGFNIDKSNRDIAPKVVSELFSLTPGQHSAIIDTGYNLEIDKVIDAPAGKVHAAHIVFKLQPITTYVSPLKAKEPPHTYVSIK